MYRMRFGLDCEGIQPYDLVGIIHVGCVSYLDSKTLERLLASFTPLSQSK